MPSTSCYMGYSSAYRKPEETALNRVLLMDPGPCQQDQDHKFNPDPEPTFKSYRI
jgi:hypothetical protein